MGGAPIPKWDLIGFEPWPTEFHGPPATPPGPQAEDPPDPPGESRPGASPASEPRSQRKLGDLGAGVGENPEERPPQEFGGGGVYLFW